MDSMCFEKQIEYFYESTIPRSTNGIIWHELKALKVEAETQFDVRSPDSQNEVPGAHKVNSFIPPAEIRSRSMIVYDRKCYDVLALASKYKF